MGSVSRSLLDGSLRIHQAEIHFSELQPRFSSAAQLPAGLQSQLEELSRSYLQAIEAGLNANSDLLQSIGLDGAQGAGVETGSASTEDIDEEIRLYQRLCRELIAIGPEPSRSAKAIADELAESSRRIHRLAATISAIVPDAQ